MDTNIILVYCLCDDLLKWQHHRDDPQCVLSDAEIMTIAIVAAMYFSGNQAMTRLLLYEQGYIKESISRSRLCHRLKRVQHQFVTLFRLLGDSAKERNEDNIYIIDSLPVVVCDNYRIRRCRLYRDDAYSGYQASKKRYFYGLKIHLVVTKDGSLSSSSCRLVPSAILLRSTSLTSNFHFTPGLSATKPVTSTTLKMLWLTAIACSCRFVKPTQNDLGSCG